MTIYSHSRLSTFENCPLQFKYNYIEKPDIVRRTSIEAFLGSRCHESLEKLYKLLIDRRLLTEEELLDDFARRWEQNFTDDIYIVKAGRTYENYFERGKKSLTDYYRRYAPFELDKTLALELRIVVDLDKSGDYKLQGYIDRLSEIEDGHYRIHDYKTAGTLMGQKYFDQDRQLALYQIGISQMYADVESVDLIWHYLTFDKEIHSSRKPDQLEELKAETVDLIKKIESAVDRDDLPPNESALCDWCDYYPICPAKVHLYKTEELPPREFRQEDGVRLVNRYIEVKQALSELKIEKDHLQQELELYALQMNATVLRGSDYKIRIKSEPTYKARYTVSKNEKEKEEFLQYIKTHGLSDEVMVVHGIKLNSLLKGDKLSPEIRDELMEHIVIEEGKPRFYASKLKPRDDY